jgi:hypothetical protein
VFKEKVEKKTVPLALSSAQGADIPSSICQHGATIEGLPVLLSPARLSQGLIRTTTHSKKTLHTESRAIV